MALTESEEARVRKIVGGFVERRRPPPRIRHQVDLAYRISGHSVEIFEIRPRWNEPSEKLELPIAKATFVRTQGIWKVYWQRADLKWHSYGEVPVVSDLGAFIAAVEEDRHACFWG